MKKVLIITYYWPPSGGGGVQRWLKFVKYLREFNWEPVVYTQEDGEVPVFDASLESEVPDGIKVIRRPVREPYAVYKKVIGQKSGDQVQTGFLTEGTKPGLLQKCSTWIRGNLFIPDARCFWIRPSVRFLSRKIPDLRPDLIISTGPPHSMHLIARKLNKKFGIPWIADFRDPWTNIDYYPRLMLTPWADRIHRKLERSVLRSANLTLTVSPSWADDFQKLGANQTEVITNGFDPSDFREAESVQADPAFTLSHIGYMNEDRNPRLLWEVLSEMSETDASFKHNLRIRLVGKTDRSALNSIKAAGLSNNTEVVDYLPHREAIREYKRASILLLLLSDTPEARGRIPGKLFEYLASGRHILCIGPPQGDSANIIKETGTGNAVNFNDREQIRQTLLDLFNQYRQGTLKVSTPETKAYQRKHLTARLAGLMDSLTS